jgi:tetratricopeptide (TPR) repeat protein
MSLPPPCPPSAEPDLDRRFAAALALQRKGKHAAAKDEYERIIAARPDHVDSLNNLAFIEWTAKNLPRALELFGRVVKHAPADAAPLRSLGLLFVDMGSYDRAATAFELAAKLAPADALSWHYLGLTCYRLERWDSAVAASLKAIELDPRNADAFQNLGVTLAATRQFDKAAELLQEAARLAPQSFGAWYNLGNQLLMLNRFDAAAEAFRRSITLQPDRAEAHLNLAIALLNDGKLQQGWREFEWRWRTEAVRSQLPPTALRRWDGSRKARTILLRAEQGFGDTLQFCRYAPLLSARGHDIVLEVQPALAGLLGHNLTSASLTVIARAPGAAGIAPPPGCEALTYLMSLPGIFETTLDTIPNAAYLQAPPDRRDVWRRRLDALPGGLRVGFAWAGSPTNNSLVVDAWRSMPLATMAPLFAVPGITFVSLQKGEAVRQLREAKLPSCHDMTDDLTDFSETAALIANLDLVICVDTAVAHLAGAMGKPVWMLSRFNGDWRWLTGRTDSPWYPTMRIFRQDASRDWPRVVAEVRHALGQWAEQQQRPPASSAA